MGKQSHGLHKRRVNTIEPRQRFLIVCEGTETEPNYFKSFKVPTHPIIEITIHGTGKNTIDVIKEAIKKRNDQTKNASKAKYDQVWCVLDRDDFPTQQFSDALDLAKKEGIRVAYSNEAFELWYLLHFDYHQSGIHRKDYITLLDKRLEIPYKKNSDKIYDYLEDKQATAINNAERLLNTYCPPNPATDNPSTTVHQLVKELNRFMKHPKE